MSGVKTLTYARLDGVERLLVEAVYWSLRYADANPEVGMGPTVRGRVQDIAAATGLELRPECEKRIVDVVTFARKNPTKWW